MWEWRGVSWMWEHVGMPVYGGQDNPQTPSVFILLLFETGSLTGLQLSELSRLAGWLMNPKEPQGIHLSLLPQHGITSPYNHTRFIISFSKGSGDEAPISLLLRQALCLPSA